MGEFRGAVATLSDMMAAVGPVFTAAASIVAKEQRKAGPSEAKPWVYDLPDRYRDTAAKRRFLVDNPKEFQALVTLRHNLRNAAKNHPFPHPEDHDVYLILLASTAGLAALLKTNSNDVRRTMECLGRWGYALDLGVRNDGNSRLGKAFLFGRMLYDGPRRPEPSWLEPPVVVPPQRAYCCQRWADTHVQTSWANPDGGGLHRAVPASWMCLPDSTCRPDPTPPTAEAARLAEAIRGR